MNKLAALFDMDGVLIDSYQAHFESWRRVAERQGVDFTEAAFVAGFGRTCREILADLWPIRLEPAAMDAAERLKEELYREIVAADFPAAAGARELLAGLRDAGVALAVGSSGPPENVELVVNRLDAGELLAARVTGNDVTRGKPDPQVFLLAAEALGVAPRRCVVVEDAVAGVRAAKAAAMACVAVLGTTTRDKLVEAGADLVVERLADLRPAAMIELIESNERKA